MCIKKDWFKLKKYPHIGFQLKKADKKWIESYVTNPEKIKKHSFLPFIHKTSKKRKFRKKYSEIDGKVEKINVEGDLKIIRHKSEKPRELFYASHLDTLIFGYYANLIAEKYENLLREKDLEDVITAYRSIPIRKGAAKNKCNIDFANDLFKYIRDYSQERFIVITFDIKSFFDNLDHKILKNAWIDVMGFSRIMEEDHFNVYKNITRFSYVDIVDIFEEFKDKIYVQKRNKDGSFSMRKRKKISRIKYLKNQNAVAFCSKKEFFDKKNKLIKDYKNIKTKTGLKRRNFGIPQGSPISSVLANIYLLKFDEAVNELVRNIGMYGRYSDDMVIVCPFGKREEIENFVYKEIENYKLEIQRSKTQTFVFERKGNELSCGQFFGNTVNSDKNLIYLGFEYNGKSVLLKSASLSNYYRRMKKHINRAIFFSRRGGKNKGEIFKRRILKKFSIIGAKRRRKYVLDPITKKWNKTHSYDWGNFISYALKAKNIMIDNKIAHQIKGRWKTINILIKNGSK